MLTANVEYRFTATHWIPGHPVCGQAHDHNWRIRVGVKRKAGYKPLDNGMVVDFKELKGWVQWAVDSSGNLLNDTVPIPTCENFIEGWLVPQLRKAFPTYLELVRIELWENEKYFCEWVK